MSDLPKQPDMEKNARELFGINYDINVPCFKEKTEYGARL